MTEGQAFGQLDRHPVVIRASADEDLGSLMVFAAQIDFSTT
jgi:hypothetical protein